MASDGAINGAFGLPFAEAEDFFRRKIHLPTAKWDDIKQAAHDRAFIVAGAAKADLLADLHRAITDAKTRGGLEEFRQHFEQIVFTHGWPYTGMDSAAGRAWRPRIIYETNLYTSYAAGRYKQLQDSPNLRYWLYRHDPLVTNPREQHLAWDGLILPRDHPFWKTHFPPNGWGCRCRVVGIERPEDARDLGGDPAKTLPQGWDAIDPKTGAPKGIGKGWGYAPGAHAATPLRELIEQKLFNLPAPIGAAMWKALAPSIAMERELDWWGMLDAWSAAEHASKQIATVGALDPATVRWLAENGKSAPATAEIAIQDALVRGAKQQRHEAAQNALTPTEWRALPAMLEAGAIYFDKDSGNLIFVADGIGPAKAAVRFAPKKAASVAANLIVSAFHVDASAIAGAVKGNEWEVVRMAGGSRTRISGE